MENKNNILKLIGRVCSDLTFSHEAHFERFYRFYVEVERLSKVKDILPVTISERMFDLAQISTGKRIIINGQIRSYNAVIPGTVKSKLELAVFAQDISLFNMSADSDYNEVEINGFICKPPVYRVTPKGRTITDILLAVNRQYNKTDYIPCIAWGRNAYFTGKLTVGYNLQFIGRVQSRTHLKTDIHNDSVIIKTVYEVSIFKVIEPGKSKEHTEA